VKYFQRRRKEKLYRQWAERAGLPPEVVPDKADESEDVHAQIHKRKAVGHKASGPVRVLPGSSAVTDVEVTGGRDKQETSTPALTVCACWGFLSNIMCGCNPSHCALLLIPLLRLFTKVTSLSKVVTTFHTPQVYGIV